MSRPSTIPTEETLRVVLSILQNQVTVAEAARREEVLERSIGNWKRQFLEGGKAGIEAGKAKLSTRTQLEGGDERAIRDRRRAHGQPRP